MKALSRKGLRDLWRLRGPVLSIALVVACGTSIFIASLSTHASLRRSRDRYYAATRFAELFVGCKHAPQAVLGRLRSLPGVAAVEGRIVKDLVLDMPGLAEPVLGRAISLPEHGRPTISRLTLRQGRWPRPLAMDEVLVSEAFAKAHHMVSGSSFAALLRGRRQVLRVVGVALSPEYVYSLAPGSFVTDDLHFGVLWMNEAALAGAFGMRSAINDVVARLDPGVAWGAVAKPLDSLLEPYGGLGAYRRDEQLSNSFVRDELQQLQVQAIFLPAIFFAVAAFLLNVVLGRLVATERTQIATLKAIGYSDRRLTWHYLQMVAFVVSLGGLVGTALAAWMGRAMTQLYVQYFHFPVLAFAMPPSTVTFAYGGSLLAGGLGAFTAVRTVVRLPPAEAMQPPAPPVYVGSWCERWGLVAALAPRSRMVLRTMLRRPARAVLSTVTLAFAVAIMISGLFWRGAVARVLHVQFGELQRDDATVMFTEPLPPRVRVSVAHLPGVRRVEAMRGAAVLLRAGVRERRTELVTLPADSSMRPALDAELRPFTVPMGSLVLGQRLAERLALRAGAVVEVLIQEGRRRRRLVRVAAVIDDYVGSLAYVHPATLASWLDESQRDSQLLLRLDALRVDKVYAALKQIPKVAGIRLRRSVLETFQRTAAKMVLVFSLILSAFASVMAVGVVYNGARISLAERSRELASLRVLGFTRREVSTLLLGELGVHLVVGIPLGLLLGYGLVAYSVQHARHDSFRIPLWVTPGTYVLSAAVVLVASVLSALWVRRQVDRLDLVEVLKTRE